MLSERGQRVAMERGVFPITPKYRVQGAPGSRAEMAVEFTGGIRSYFDVEVTNIYDDDVAQRRYEQAERTDAELEWHAAPPTGQARAPGPRPPPLLQPWWRSARSLIRWRGERTA